MATSGLFEPDAGLPRRQAELRPAPAHENDADLVSALRRGEAGAAGRIYDRHSASVHGMVYRLLGREAELDDIVQEVFIYALHSIDKLRDPAALKSWLLGIAVGKVRSHLRWRFRRRWLAFLPHDQVPEPAVPVDEPDADLVSQVRGILDNLPAEERVALVVHRIEGLSLQEAAAASGMSLSTFKRRLAKGEARFRALAKQHPGLLGILGGSPS
ncbi:MAG: sigma-70 family RNA polymerase sigma factor [Pseudomonadota bacterium]